MSLLADLLSKKRWSESSGGKDIPPTLARTRNSSTMGKTSTKLYIGVAVAAIVVVIAGLFMMPALKSRFAQKIETKAAPPLQIAQLQPMPQIPPPPFQPVATLTTPDAKTPPATPEKLPVAKSAHPGQQPASRRSTARKNPEIKSSRKSAAKVAAVAPVKPRKEAASPPAKIDTEARGALLYAARSAEQSGDWRSALDNYRRALEIDPENYRIMSNSAAAFNNLGMYEEGGREARKALARKPNYVPALVNAAIAYSSRGNSQEALRLFSEAYKAEPGNRGLAINFAILQERMGKLDEALAIYSKLAAAGDHLALLGMGRVYERKGDRGGAVNSYRQILAMSDISPSQKKDVKERLVRLQE